MESVGEEQYMDLTLSVSTLQKHSENLRKLATILSTDLRKLRLELSEQGGASTTEELNLLVELDELNSSLFTATDNFYQCLHKFLTSGKVGDGLRLGN
jgi:hypothetical protein